MRTGDARRGRAFLDDGDEQGRAGRLRRVMSSSWRVADRPASAVAGGSERSAKSAGHEPPRPRGDDPAGATSELDLRDRRLRRQVRAVLANGDSVEFALAVRAARCGDTTARARRPRPSATATARRPAGWPTPPRLVLVVTTNGAVLLCRPGFAVRRAQLVQRFDSVHVIGECDVTPGSSSIEIGACRYQVHRIWMSHLLRLHNMQQLPVVGRGSPSSLDP